jgi:cyclophilin family peptidyl-prolyl cis-trans isomerase/HEAT repeat protein
VLIAVLLAGCGLFGTSSKDKLNQIAVWEDQGWTANGQLTRLMFDRDADVRYRAALAVARVNDTLAVDSIRLVLQKDPDPRVRAVAALAPAAWTWHRGVSALVEALSRETDPEVLVAILQACGRCYTRDEYQKILPFLRHADPRVRTQALLTLDLTARHDMADSMLVLLDDPDPRVRWTALSVLSHARSDSAARRAMPFCRDTSAAVRKLGRVIVGSSAIPGARDTLLEGLYDPNPLVRAGSADALGNYADTLSAHRLFPFLETEKDPRVLQHLVTAVGEHWRIQAQPYLERLLRHPDAGVRAATVTALSKRLDFQYAELIAPAVRDSDPRVQMTFCEVLDQSRQYAPVDTARVFPGLRTLMEDSVPRVRARAAQSYIGLGGTDSDKHLNRLFNDKDPSAQQMAVSLIGSYNVAFYQDSLLRLYDKYKTQWRPEIKWSIIASTANMAPSIHPEPVPREIFSLGLTDPNRLVRWYAIAVWEKFREDHRSKLGTYRTDLTPANVDSLLHPFPGNPSARIQTTRGPVVLELRSDLAPRAVRQFIRLARQGFYDDCPMNDIQFGSIVQTGDRRGDGWGLPDETVRDELSLERVEPGSVIWLINSRDSGHGSFSIALDRLPYLDWRYAVFGRVTEGLDRVAALTYADSIRTVEILTPGL